MPFHGALFSLGERDTPPENQKLAAAIWATAGFAGGWDIGILTVQEILSLLDWEEDQQGEYEVAAVAVYHVIGWQLQGHQTDHQDMVFQNLWLVGCARTAIFLVIFFFNFRTTGNMFLKDLNKNPTKGFWPIMSRIYWPTLRLKLLSQCNF